MPPSADPSVLAVLDTVRTQHPDAPFLALGQTALWDEPTKAIWRRLLDENLPGARLVAGVHDTDYFAKTAAHLGSDRKYVALPHDDGRTRDLWSAAGELSCLFGSESVPTRHMFLKRGVPFDWLAKVYPGGKDALLADKTAAWGWRGIVSTESHSVIAHDVPILEIKDALLEQLDWGFAESLACLADDRSRAAASEVAATVRGWVTDFLATCTTNCRLSDLYQTLLPRFYALLLGDAPAALEVTASTQLFRFNAATCHLPRFQLLGIFVNPATRPLACRAYNKAVGGSGIYTLEGFGDGAVPFDVVIPRQGRGTLRLTNRGVVIETAPTPTTVGAGPVNSIEELAALLEQEFGPDVVLVGKAVTLADMIASEFLVVFHETASGYTSLTQGLNVQLAQAGISLPLLPLIRLSYPTWDALGALPASTEFRLPPHLASAFGRDTLSAPEFAAQWRVVVEAQQHVLRESAALHRARDLMTYLEGKDGHCWCDRLNEYEQALGVLKGIAAKSRTLAERVDEHEDQLQMWQKERQGLERRKGDDWRTNVQPLREKLRQGEASGQHPETLQRDIARQTATRARAFDEPLEVCRERIGATKSLLAEFRRQRRLLERSAPAQQARATLALLVADAQLARLDLVRNAHLTVEGLEHTNLRPTAWWLPLVDPTGAWFAALVAGTQARLEPLT